MSLDMENRSTNRGCIRDLTSGERWFPLRGSAAGSGAAAPTENDTVNGSAKLQVADAHLVADY